MTVFLTILKILMLAAGIGYGFGNVTRAIIVNVSILGITSGQLNLHQQ